MVQKIKLKDQTNLGNWSIDQARELYNMKEWGQGFFDINAKGNMLVLPDKNRQKYLDIKAFIDQLRQRGINPPVLIRFTDIMKKRIEEIRSAFQKAIGEYEYKGRYFGVYPIKVNQSKQVVEDILEFGEDYHFGLESGTKAELLIALASMTDLEAPIICNGYKDDEYIEMALWATKMGRKVFVVVEKPSEVEIIIRWAKKLRVQPLIGIRAKLSARGRGKWEASGGEKSKFGLFPAEILEALAKFDEAGMQDRVQLLHFHLGSQITAIQSIKDAMRESCRIYAELIRMGVGIQYFDVGGGLAVDYDGSRTNFSSSANYSIEEYAYDVVDALSEICQSEKLPQPHILSESGRALVAYHSVLVFNVLGTIELIEEEKPLEIPDDAPEEVVTLQEIAESITVKNFQESYHDAIQIRDETMMMFNMGMMTLPHRALVERLFWLICHRITRVIHNLDYVPDELENLDRFISDTYYCNLSVFQSLPDHWAVKQLFPICPIHKLNERPTRKTTLADITCDSDGKIDQFIDLHDVNNTLDLHEFFPGKPYYLGAFLVGAYQEALGDLHNLFGDTHTVHVTITGRGKYRIDKTIEGDRVQDVLGYVQYQKRDLMNAIRKTVEESIQEKRITIKESARVKKFLEEGLEGYTYLE